MIFLVKIMQVIIEKGRDYPEISELIPKFFKQKIKDFVHESNKSEKATSRNHCNVDDTIKYQEMKTWIEEYRNNVLYY